MSVQRFEQIITIPNGQELFFQVWLPTDYKKTLILTHGLSEHSECYHSLATQLCKDLNWAVVAWDLQGHGRSSGKRGFVLQFENYLEDFSHLMDFLQKNSILKEPPTLFGHSLGGLITLRYYLADKPNIKGICLSSPALGLFDGEKTGSSRWLVTRVKKKIAQIANVYWPQLTLAHGINKADLVQDKDLIRAYKKDPLRHDRISPRLFTGMLESIKIVQERVEEIRVPLLLQTPEKEKVTSTKASLIFFRKLKGSPKKIHHLYNSSYHEIFNDIEKDLAIADLKTFLNELT